MRNICIVKSFVWMTLLLGCDRKSEDATRKERQEGMHLSQGFDCEAFARISFDEDGKDYVVATRDEVDALWVEFTWTDPSEQRYSVDCYYQPSDG